MAKLTHLEAERIKSMLNDNIQKQLATLVSLNRPELVNRDYADIFENYECGEELAFLSKWKKIVIIMRIL